MLYKEWVGPDLASTIGRALAKYRISDSRGFAYLPSGYKILVGTEHLYCVPAPEHNDNALKIAFRSIDNEEVE